MPQRKDGELGQLWGSYVMGRGGNARKGIRSDIRNWSRDLAAEISRLQVQGEEGNNWGEE